MRVELIRHTENAEELIAAAARVCYTSDKASEMIEKIDQETVDKMIKVAMDNHHDSILEHISFTFLIEDVSRALTHQLVRHRLCTYCVTGDTIIPSFSQKKRTIAELYGMYKTKSKKGPFKALRIRSLDENTLTIIPNSVEEVFYNGIRDVWKVTTQSGRQIKCTKEHQFLSSDGWNTLENMSIGCSIYVNGIEVLENEEWLRRNYLDLNRTRKELAGVIGCCEAVLHKAFKKFGIVKPHSQYPNRQPPSYHTRDHITDEFRSRLRLSKLGERNPRYVSDRSQISVSRAYTLTHELYDNEHNTCELCGSSDNLEIHHIDRNPLNVERDNVMILCQTCHKLWHHPGVRGAFLDKIVAIEYGGKEPVYDIAVTGTNHNYVANGIVVHNSQRSQRYVKVEDLLSNYVAPESIRDNIEAKMTFEYALDTIAACYKRLIEEFNIPKEDARYLLPNATTSQLIMTTNARNLIHIFGLRCCNRAQSEIHELADRMLQKCREVLPSIFNRVGPNCYNNRGFCPEGKMHCGKRKLVMDRYNPERTEKFI